MLMCDLGLFRRGWAAWWSPAIGAGRAALLGPPWGGHVCLWLGSPPWHPEAGLLGALRPAAGLAQEVPGWHRMGLSAAQSFACWVPLVPFYPDVFNSGMVGEHQHHSSMAPLLGPAGNDPGPLAMAGPVAGKAGQHACRTRTWPLSAATALGTRCALSSSEFPFAVFVSFLLTFFPSGIKGWMETMVTGWCGQLDPEAGVAPRRGQHCPATRLCPSP